ncbi:MAG TPA: hypothetical protein VI485_28780 [Vicinamibacterales bacterium]|nr:hypothetical protein [Vicinamibacterales bacterium]
MGVGLFWLFGVIIGYLLFVPMGAIFHLVCIVTAASGSSPMPLPQTAAAAPSPEPTPVPAQRAPMARSNKLLAIVVVGFLILVGVVAWVVNEWTPSARPFRVGSLDLQIAVVSDGARVTNTGALSWTECVASLGESQARIDNIGPKAEIKIPFGSFQPALPPDAVFHRGTVRCTSSR